MRTSGSKAAPEGKQLLVSLSIPKFVRACRNADELRNRDTSAANPKFAQGFGASHANFGFKSGTGREAIASVLSIPKFVRACRNADELRNRDTSSVSAA
jgi:hypothetical protein